MAFLDKEGLKFFVEQLSTRAPYIMESSNSGDAWYYEKWSDGRLICCRTFSTNSLAFPTNANWGSLFTASWMNTATNKSGRRYPIPFISQPIVSATPITGGANFWVCTNQENDGGKDGDGYTMSRLTHVPAWQCVRGSSGTITNPQVTVRAEGYWK